MTPERSTYAHTSCTLVVFITALLWAGCGTDEGADCVGEACDDEVVIVEPSCASDAECPVGKRCSDGVCVARGEECSADLECGPGYRCESGACFPTATPVERIGDAGTGGDGDVGPSGTADAGHADDTGGETTVDAGCTGCFSVDGTCYPGTQRATCGTGGSACISCTSTQQCVDGACAIAAESRWDLTVVRAELPATNASGQSWDPSGGRPDPFVRVEVGASTVREGESSTAQNTLTPEWNSLLLDGVTAAEIDEAWLVWIYDVDDGGQELISHCGVNIPDPTAVYTGDIFRLRCTAYDDTKSAIYWRLTPD